MDSTDFLIHQGFGIIDKLCEIAERISLEELREISPELAAQIDRMQKRLGNNCPDGIMNTFEYFKTADGNIVVRSNSQDFRNSHIIVIGYDAYCSAGDRNDDNHLNEFINEKILMKNFTYDIDRHLTYMTDDLGRVVYLKEVYFNGETYLEEVYLNGKTTERSSDTRKYHQNNLNSIRDSKDGRSGGLDHAGHLVAYNFNGPTEGINIVPMSKELNKGEWRKMESKVGSAIDNKSDVILEKHIKYEGESYRPTAIDVTCTIDNTKENYCFDNK